MDSLVSRSLAAGPLLLVALSLGWLAQDAGAQGTRIGAPGIPPGLGTDRNCTAAAYRVSESYSVRGMGAPREPNRSAVFTDPRDTERILVPATPGAQGGFQDVWVIGL